ncbi:hypothetical protein L9F63_021511, partial [Diploptera punctata]
VKPRLRYTVLFIYLVLLHSSFCQNLSLIPIFSYYSFSFLVIRTTPYILGPRIGICDRYYFKPITMTTWLSLKSPTHFTPSRTLVGGCASRWKPTT